MKTTYEEEAEPRERREPTNLQSDNLPEAISNTEKLFVQLLEISKTRNGGVAGKEFFDLLNVLFDHPDDAAHVAPALIVADFSLNSDVLYARSLSC